MLLIWTSKPCSSSAAGSPSFETHVEGGQIFPSGDEVWKIFCGRERDENPIRTRSLPCAGLRLKLDSERWVSKSDKADRLGDRAQKQVTRMISVWADIRKGIIEDSYKLSPLPTLKADTRDVLDDDNVLAKATVEIFEEMEEVVVDCTDPMAIVPLADSHAEHMQRQTGVTANDIDRQKLWNDTETYPVLAGCKFRAAA